MKKAILLAALVLTAFSAYAQSGLHKVNWRDARVTGLGAYMTDIRLEEKYNAETQQTDTLLVDRSRVVWEKDGYNVPLSESDERPAQVEK